MAQRIKLFVVNHAPLLTTITIFILVFIMGGLLYPAMQKPQVFFNLFINTASLLIVAIGMTFVIITGGIDLSVAGMIALTSAASAALLAKGAAPVLVMPLMLLMGIAFGFTLGSIIHYSESAAFYCDLDGPLFCARYGLYHHPGSFTHPGRHLSVSGIDESAYSPLCEGLCVYSFPDRPAALNRGHLRILLHTLRPHSLCDWQ